MINRQIQLQQFQLIYQQLNYNQQLAVNTIEGPVMVIAGPGTGKTQILSARIGKILLETDALPQNILCLTYTDAGTVAMRKRLVSFIGTDAYKVNIHTFHSFCNEIIQDNLSLFNKNTLDAISDLEKIDLYRQLIDSFPKNHPLKRYRGDVYYEVKNLQSLFSNMKKEGWTPQFIHQEIDRYLADLPNRDGYITKRATKEFKKGDIRTDKIALEAEKMQKLRAAVDAFPQFQQLMLKHNRYDFDDMINWVIQAFEENTALLQTYQEQYLYILVDEYQDTSGTQNKIVELLINFWDKPNIFVVGDDDQSIYRFQGANVTNMYKFADLYSQQLLTVVLTNNYRSTQPILEAAKTIIEPNKERLIHQIPGLSKNLVAANTGINHLKHPPQIIEYLTPGEEMMGIVLAVEKLIAQGVTPGNIGILYKENKYGEELTQFFAIKNIPIYSKRKLNLFDQPLIKQLITLLKYLVAEHDTPFGGEGYLFEILHYQWFKLPALAVSQLSMEVYTKSFTNDKTTLRQLLAEKGKQAAAQLFSSSEAQQMQQVSNILEKLIADVPNVTLIHLLENIVQTSGVLAFVMQHENKHSLLQMLTQFFDFVKDEAHRDPLMGAEKLVKTIEVMQTESIALPFVQVTGTDKAVNLLTTHGSKGLEFEYVFLAGCNAAYWEKKNKKNDGFPLPDTLWNSTGLKDAGANAEELRRLFYVAVTRAEKHLIVSYSKYKKDGKELEPSMFVAEIALAHNLQPTSATYTDDEKLAFQALLFTKKQAPEIAKMEALIVGKIVEKFSMNVTALNNYLSCPLKFYFNNIVRVPAGKSEATEFGSAVHYALQKLFEKMLANTEKHFPPVTTLIEDFNFYMGKHRESFTKEQFNRRMEIGPEILENYYHTYITQANKVVAIERSIRNVIVKGVPLKGKLDKLEFDGKMVNVVDYKTGDHEKAKKKLNAPNPKEPNGGDYWRQAVFYKILVDNYDQKDWKVISTEFDFVEPDKKKQYHKEKVVITDEDITTVTHQITDTWQKIQQHQFYTGCGKDDCHWCNFSKQNALTVALHDLVDEAEE
ncbi:MAG: ATP-dependent helicase [Chitinophagaceae bacterium]